MSAAGKTLVTLSSFRDLLDARHRELIVHGEYVPPLFSFLTPARYNHVPYLVL